MVIAGILFSVAGGLVLLLVAGRYRESLLDFDWEPFVTQSGRRAVDTLRNRFNIEQPVIDLALGRPLQLAADGETDEALRLLAAGYDYLSSLATDREQLLRSMARYSRMVTALMPMPPLRPRAFRLRQLRTLAGLGAFAHHLLVTVPERYRLRLGVLRHGIGIVLRALLDAGVSGASPRWSLAAAAKADWHTLDAETLESFHALMTGLLTATPAAAERGA